MVKNLVDSDRGVQIVGTSKTIKSILPWFFTLLKDMPDKPDLLVCEFDITMEKVMFLDNDDDFLSDIEDRFSKQGKKPGNIRTAKGSPDELSLLIRDHALSMCPMPQLHNPMAMMMSLSPCPVMFCPGFKTN
jgi:hypothetical protein